MKTNQAFLQRLLIALLLCCGNAVWAQSLTLSLSVAPPYSPYLNDYVTYGNKALLTVVNSSGGPVSFYLKARITGDNGINGSTRPGFKPASPMVISMPSAIFKGLDFEGYFSQNNFSLTGTTIDNVVTGAGLPEGNYQICVQAFDWNTNAEVSAEVCASINIVYAEAPVAISPGCGTTYPNNPAQAVPFAWTPPPGIPGVQYILRMTPVWRNGDPNNAINTITEPPFFQTFGVLNVPSYTYRLSDPKLTKGTLYAWQVTAIDPSGKYLIRNNGRSPVCTFRYGDTDVTVPASYPDTLIITNPLCRLYKDANGVSRIDSNVTEAQGNKLFYSSEKDLGLSWIWNTQDIPANGIPEKKKTANGAAITAYKVIFTPLNLSGEGRVAVKGDKTVTKELITDQFVNISAAQADVMGLKADHWYMVTVQAIGVGGSGPTGVRILAEAKSCEVRIIRSADSVKQIKFTGTLAYNLEDGGSLYPANNVKLAFRLAVSGEKSKSSVTADSYGAEPSYPCSTDAQGNFSVWIPVPKEKESNKYISISILNPYYRSMDSCLSVTLSTTAANGVVAKLKDSIELGQVKVEALTYSLKVKVGKGFPKFYYDTLGKEVSVQNDQYVIDTTTIKPRVRVKAGIPVVIYRYAKSSDMPLREGDYTVQATVRGKTMMKVAEAVTSIENAGASDEQTVVNFKRLLCNMRDDDEYYIKAILPNDSTQRGAAKNPFQVASTKATDVYALTADGDLDAFLEAPEQIFRFKPTAFQLQQFKNRFTQNTGYNLISTLPPMSTVSGKMVYTWPGYNVQRPLTNAKFVVRMIYTFNGKEGFPEAAQPDGSKYCFAKSQVELNGKPGDGVIQENEEIISSDMDGVVLGTGTTDAQGNFKINFINYDKKGTISTNGHQVTAMYPCPPEEKVDGKNKVIDPVSQKVLGYDDDWSFGANWKDMYNNAQHGDDVSNGMNKGKGYSGSTQFISEHGVSATAAGNATTKTANSSLGKGGVEIGGKTMNKSYGANYTGAREEEDHYAFEMPGLHGPMPGVNPVVKNTANTVVADGNIAVGRMLVVELVGPHTSFYGERMDGGNLDQGGHFIMQAFDKGDLGTLTTQVKNWKGQTKVVFQKQNDKGKWETVSKPDASGVRMTIYRPAGTKPALTPLGEGTANHPSKVLLQSSVAGAITGDPVEWVIDTSLSMNADGSFVVGDVHSIAVAAKNKIQIASNPEADLATQFEPVEGATLGGTYYLKLKEGKIIGRVTEAGTDKGIQSYVNIYCSGCQKGDVNGIDLGFSVATDAQGYFEYKNGMVVNGRSYSWDANSDQNKPVITCYAFKAGYGNKNSVTLPVPSLGQQRRYNLQLSPGCKISGTVRGEDGNAISAYIMRLPDTTLVPTPKNGTPFEVYAPSGSGIQLKIIPQDPAYFDTLISVKTPDSGPLDLKHIYLPKRLHRMQFDITLTNADGVIKLGKEMEAGLIKIAINADQQLTKVNTLNNPSLAFSFANVSVNNYTVMVTDAKGRGYIPQVLHLTNKESRNMQVYKITLRMGDSLTGKVTRIGDFAVQNARVYLDQSNGSSQTDPKDTAWNAMETTTDANGRYVLRGIPRLPKVRVHATVQGYGVLIDGGDTTLSIKGGGAVANFFLKDVCQADISNVYGFPFAVESAKPAGTNKYKITGVLNLSANKTRLSWLDNKTKVRIEDVVFVQQSVNGKNVLLPETPDLKLSETNLKMKLAGRYNLSISGLMATSVIIVNGKPVQTGGTQPLLLSKDGSGGTVFANARIVDNSYNYPSTYLNFDKSGEFHLATWQSGDQKMKMNVPVISTLNKTDLYQLTNKDGDSLSFSFIGFDAKAGPKASYIDDAGKIHLNVNFRGQAGNSQPGFVDVHIRQIILDQNKIDAATFTDPLHLKLENWDLEVKQWSVDPAKGGLYSERAVIHTGVADIPMGLFNLRHDLFVLQQPKLDSLTLGGGLVALVNISPKASLVYDMKTGSDLGEHWRLSVSSEGTKPAASFNLKTKYGNTKLDLDYFQMISYNNENIISLRKSAEIPVGNNGRIHYIPDGIATNPDFFVLQGTATFDVPRTPSVSIGMKYTSEGNMLKQEIAPFSFYIRRKRLYALYLSGRREST
ncbi:MAG: hypothetical protein QM743_03130 [Chitinophagaceae bacterium]